MTIQENIEQIKKELPENVSLAAVSKTKSVSEILEAYNSGQRIFAENKMQELSQKASELPKDISWHMIGHLQSNKIKLIAPFVNLIESVDSLNILREINKHAATNNRIIDVLLQVFISKEPTKQGLLEDELLLILESEELRNLKNIRVRGLMGIASNTKDSKIIKQEFCSLSNIYNSIKDLYNFDILSMGMSSDYKIALSCGSNLVRIGSLIFGERQKN